MVTLLHFIKSILYRPFQTLFWKMWTFRKSKKCTQVIKKFKHCERVPPGSPSQKQPGRQLQSVHVPARVCALSTVFTQLWDVTLTWPFHLLHLRDLFVSPA